MTPGSSAHVCKTKHLKAKTKQFNATLGFVTRSPCITLEERPLVHISPCASSVSSPKVSTFPGGVLLSSSGVLGTNSLVLGGDDVHAFCWLHTEEIERSQRGGFRIRDDLFRRDR